LLAILQLIVLNCIEKKKTVKAGFIDQILHLSVIAAIVRFIIYEIDFEVVSSSKV
jgi:hypothetical protein